MIRLKKWRRFPVMKPTTTTSLKEKYPGYSKVSFIERPSQQEESDYSDRLLNDTLQRLLDKKEQQEAKK